MSKKHKKVCATLNYVEHFLILAFDSLAGIPIAIMSAAIGLKICAITKKKKKKDGSIVLLSKSKLNSIEVFISKALTDSVISYDEFVLINNMLKEYNEMKEEIKILKTYSSLSKI